MHIILKIRLVDIIARNHLIFIGGGAFFIILGLVYATLLVSGWSAAQTGKSYKANENFQQKHKTEEINPKIKLSSSNAAQNWAIYAKHFAPRANPNSRREIVTSGTNWSQVTSRTNYTEWTHPVMVDVGSTNHVPRFNCRLILVLSTNQSAST